MNKTLEQLKQEIKDMGYDSNKIIFGSVDQRKSLLIKERESKKAELLGHDKDYRKDEEEL
jgi:hypothetical protein